VLVLHPRYLFGALEPSVYDQYKALNYSRARGSYKAMSEMMITNSLVKIKESPPYTPELESSVLFNSLARAQPDKAGSFSFPKKLATTPSLDLGNVNHVADLLKDNKSGAGVGVDQGNR
jgi:fatty acid synthase subunit alpha, fungi type